MTAWGDELRERDLPDDALLVDLLIEEFGENEAGETDSKQVYRMASERDIPGEVVSKVLWYLKRKARAKKARAR